MTRSGLLSLALAAALAIACNGRPENTSNAQREADGVGTAGEAVSNADKDFAEKTMVGNMAEVELGQMAARRALRAEVKSFADMMVRDHTMASGELRQIATSHGILVPTQLDEKHQELRNRLMGLNGAAFEREYMNAMVQGHEDMADLLQTRANEDRFGDDKGAVRPERSDNPVEASLNAWAAKALPTVRHHLDEAKRVLESLDDQTTRR